MVREGFSLDEVRQNMNNLLGRSTVMYKPLDSEKFEPINPIYVCMLAALGNESYPVNLFRSKSDKRVGKMINDGLVTIVDDQIKVSDKAKNAEYTFFCNLRDFQ